jgi:hypothetical protein
LFLLDDHPRIGADRAEVEVILHAKGQPQHQGQQQQQPGTEALYLGRKLHAQTKKNVPASDVRVLVNTTRCAFILTLTSAKIPGPVATNLELAQALARSVPANCVKSITF